MKRTTLIFLSALLFSAMAFAQNNVQLGSSLDQLRTPSQGAFYDYSDPAAVNIKVSVWGFVKFPGKYIIPGYSSVNDLLSFAGGPTDAARLEDMKLVRTNQDSSQTIIPLNYKDVLFNNEITSMKKAPPLEAGDVLLVTGEPRYYFRDYLTMGLSIVSTVISLAILVLNIVKK